MPSKLRLFSLPLLLVACSRPAPPPAQPQATSTQVTTSAPKQTPQPLRTALSQRCTNTQSGFSVSYPAGWSTNDASVLPICSAFDSAPFEVPPQSEMPFDIAIVIGAQDVPFAADVTSNQFERVLSSEKTTIAGRKAVRVEAEATGEGLADRGMRSLRYVLDLGEGRTLVATTNDAGPSYTQEKEILSRMMETISIP
jgi:hypothetical protein